MLVRISEVLLILEIRQVRESTRLRGGLSSALESRLAHHLVSAAEVKGEITVFVSLSQEQQQQRRGQAVKDWANQRLAQPENAPYSPM